MADYFTNFSFIVPLPAEAAQKRALELAQCARDACFDGSEPAGFPAQLLSSVEDWRFETAAVSAEGKWALWLHSSDGGIDAVCAFVQHLLGEFDPTGSVGFEWSCDCSKPRTDAYGGGAAFITASEIQTQSTGEWLQEKTAAHACKTRKGKNR